MKNNKHQLERQIRKDSLKPSELRDQAIERMIRSIPKGKVSSYSAVAAAAGYPLYHRLVAKLLRGCGDRLPWHRVLGADGSIRLRHEAAYEQRLRLEMEGVHFAGKRVDLAAHAHRFRQWEGEQEGDREELD
jgi:methylated-DNA-protein-cysteine methyltransferase-like protein